MTPPGNIAVGGIVAQYLSKNDGSLPSHAVDGKIYTRYLTTRFNKFSNYGINFGRSVVVTNVRLILLQQGKHMHNFSLHLIQSLMEYHRTCGIWLLVPDRNTCSWHTNQGQGQVIASDSICGIHLLVPALDTCFWHRRPQCWIYQPGYCWC